jgi:hemerythrin-like domain-containing protein
MPSSSHCFFNAENTMSTINTEQPLVNFSNCHVGIVSQLERLSELPALLAPADLARKTAQHALAFFPKAIYEHHADEEKELFPSVLASAQVGVERMRVEALVNNLISQHRRLEHLWESLVSDLGKVAKGQSHQLNTAALQDLVTAYQAHASMEEEEFLPLSEEILGRNSNHMAALGLSLHLRHRPYVSAHI